MYGARFVNVHIGSHRGLGRDEGLRRLVDGIAMSWRGRGGRAGARAGELGRQRRRHRQLDRGPGRIVDLAPPRGVDGIGFCLDTAHLWAAGYASTARPAWRSSSSAIDALLGPASTWSCSISTTRARRAARASIATSTSAPATSARPAWARVLRHPWLGRLPAYLETPGMDDGYDAVNLERAARCCAASRCRHRRRHLPRDRGRARGRPADRPCSRVGASPDRRRPHQTAPLCCTGRSQIERTKGLYLGIRGRSRMMPASNRRSAPDACVCRAAEIETDERPERARLQRMVEDAAQGERRCRSASWRSSRVSTTRRFRVWCAAIARPRWARRPSSPAACASSATSPRRRTTSASSPRRPATPPPASSTPCARTTC